MKNPLKNVTHVSSGGITHRPIYQRLINNRCALDMVEDIRVPIVGESIPCIWSKKKPMTSTFHSHEPKKDIVSMHDKGDYFTSKEIQLILSFAKSFGVDFADIDILRDNSDGKIYIIDVK